MGLNKNNTSGVGRSSAMTMFCAQTPCQCSHLRRKVVRSAAMSSSVRSTSLVVYQWPVVTRRIGLEGRNGVGGRELEGECCRFDDSLMAVVDIVVVAI